MCVCMCISALTKSINCYFNHLTEINSDILNINYKQTEHE